MTRRMRATNAAIAAALLASGAAARADTYTDDFSAGVDPLYWIVSTNQPLYMVDDSQGDVRFSKPEGGSFTFQAVNLEFAYPVRGDFDVQVGFRDASITRVNGQPGNQLQLNVLFGEQFFAVVRSDEAFTGNNVHVFQNPPGQWMGTQSTVVTAGALRIMRTGTTVSGYLNGALIHAAALNAEDVVNVWFSLQNNGTTDPTSVIFDDFQLVADEILGPPAGQIPDGSSGPPLELTRDPDGVLTLAWGASCAAGDDDYAVYEGLLGDFSSHAPLLCTTAGLTSVTFVEPLGSAYYLVVPRNDRREGSYGVGVAGSERPASATPCLPRSTGACSAPLRGGETALTPRGVSTGG